VMADTRDIRVADLRGRERFAEETRPRAGILRDPSVDYFKRDDRIQHCVARAISYRHCSRAELYWKAVRADFDFKMIVLQRSGCQSSPAFGFVWLLAVAQKTKTNETTKALTFLTCLRGRSSDGCKGFEDP